MKRSYTGTVEQGRIQFDAPTTGLMKQHIAAHEGRLVDVVIGPHVKTRTDRQSRYYFGVVVPLLADFCGYEKDEMHETLAMRFLRIEDCPVTGAPRRKRTPKTNTKEFADYVDACIRLAAEHGVYIPDPGEQMRAA